MKYATRPATNGVAMDVPESVLVEPFFHVEVMYEPGAKILTLAPKLEKKARVSDMSTAPTVIAVVTWAGLVNALSVLLLPAATVQ
jgi:hypothetical protein